jgi:hypothetical protein
MAKATSKIPKGTYETKPMVPSEKKTKKGKQVEETKEACALCKSENVVVQIVGNIKSVACQVSKCGYVGTYNNGKLV